MITEHRETKRTPDNVANAVTLAGGFNIFGRPNFRVIWGWNRLTWIAGKWEDRDQDGNLIREVVELREEPKYPELNRWHIEKWMPPEFYGSPAKWRMQTEEIEGSYTYEALGPYPSRGDYEHCFTLKDPDTGDFLDLTPEMVRYIVRAVEFSRHLLCSDRKRHMDEREEKAEKQWDTRADAILDDAGPAFHGQPYIVVPTVAETLNLGRQRRGF